MPNLYLVGTPIGNLEDISLRALRILQDVSLIAAEDTRVTRRLLERYEIRTRLTSFHEYSGPGRVEDLLQSLEADDIALVSDAGMPGLSDPGYQLVEACIEAGIEIIPIPGPTAAVTALVASGMPTGKFLYLGFLPRRKQARRRAIVEIAVLPYTMVIFEAPKRVVQLLTDIHEILGDRRVCIGRELTKMYEEIWRGSASEAISRFKASEIRGEITLIVDGAAEAPWDEKLVIEALAAELDGGATRKEAVEVVVNLSGWRKRDVYRLSLSINQD